ncbi:ABC transporter permease [Chloroflexota bacterium]
MAGLRAVFWKELADHFSSWRFVILFGVMFVAGVWGTYVAGDVIRSELAKDPTEFVFLRLFTVHREGMWSFIQFLGFFGPLIGLIMGFDAINSERSSGTLSRILSQPLFRDSVINGKFLAGVFTITIMLGGIITLMAGMGLRMIGIPPSMEEFWRIGAFFALGVIYLSFWLGLGMLLSILFRRAATSALAAIALWLFFAIFIIMIADAVADYRVPVDSESDTATQIRNIETEQMVMRVSPRYLFDEATGALLSPTVKSLAPLSQAQVERLLPSPLPFGQSLVLVWPHLTALMALTVVCFAISYVSFMRQEIRST